MTKHETPKKLPYDFSNWLIGEHELPRNHGELEKIAREAIEFAFQGFRDGYWKIAPQSDQLEWEPNSDIYGDGPPPAYVRIKPADIVPLFTGDLARTLSVYPRFDIECQDYEEDRWPEIWKERLAIIKAWRTAFTQCIRAMHSMQNERNEPDPTEAFMDNDRNKG